jgi:hypothetical protein
VFSAGVLSGIGIGTAMDTNLTEIKGKRRSTQMDEINMAMTRGFQKEIKEINNNTLQIIRYVY